MAPRRALIVDDNLPLAENIAEFLEAGGYLTQVATSAEEGLSKALPDTPDIVVTDYRLPGISGAEFIRQLRQSMSARLRAVVISGYTDANTVADAIDAGAVFLAKPVDFGALSQVVGQERPA